MKKITKPYLQFYIFPPSQPFVAVRGRIYVLADWHPNRCRTLRKHTRIISPPLDMKGCICHFKWQIHPFISKGTICMPFMGQTLRIHLPYGTLYMPLRTSHTRFSEWAYVRHVTIQVAVQSEHKPYYECRYVPCEFFTHHANHTTYQFVPPAQNVELTVRNPSWAIRKMAIQV